MPKPQPPTPEQLAELPIKGVFRLRGSEMTRTETFTDAAFAFALTLLVISLEPPTSEVALLRAMREIPAFLLSGAFLMIFWWGHHEWSRRYGLDDGPTAILSWVLVFTVLIYVVPLRFLMGILFLWIGALTGLPVGPTGLDLSRPDALNLMFLIYGIGFSAMSGAIVLLYRHAWRRRESLALSPAEAHETRADMGIWAILSLTGAVSAVVALLSPRPELGLPGWVYMTLAFTPVWYGKRADRRRPPAEPEG